MPTPKSSSRSSRLLAAPPSRRTSTFVLALVPVVFVAASCGPGRGTKGTTSTLGLGTDPTSNAATAKFGVVYARPRGPTTDTSQVTIVFNRAVHALEVAGEEAPVGVTITPKGSSAAPKGEFRWVGTHALAYSVRDALPRGSEYDVVVPKGFKAVDGAVLEEPYTFSFETPRPDVLSVSPSNGTSELGPKAYFELTFNQPVDPKALEGHLVLGAGTPPSSTPVATRIESANVKGVVQKNRVRVTPVAPLPLASTLSLKLDGTWRGVEGPLGPRGPREFSFSTYDALRVVDASCWRSNATEPCHPGGGISLTFSTSVKQKELAKFVTVEPALPLAWPKESDESDYPSAYRSLPLRLPPKAQIRVTVKAGLTDQWGQKLADDRSFTFTSTDASPALVVGIEGKTLEANVVLGKPAPVAIPIASVNVENYEVLAAALDERHVVDLERGRSGYEIDLAKLEAIPGLKRRPYGPFGASSNRVETKFFDVDFAFPARGTFGPFAFAVPSSQTTSSTTARLVSRTDLAIGTRISKFGGLVWVTRLSTGAPVAGASVKVVNGRLEDAFLGVTDGDGVLAVPGDRMMGVRDATTGDTPSTLVFARSGDDWTYTVPDTDSFDSWRWDLHLDPSGALDPDGIVFTDRGVYRPGETLHASGIVRIPLARGMETPKGRHVSLRAIDTTGEKVWTGETVLDEFGAYAMDVPLPATTQLGNLSLSARLLPAVAVPAAKPTLRKPSWAGGSDETRDDGERAGYQSVEIAAYKASEFKVAVETSAKSFVRGDTLAATTRADYLFGAPMGGATVRTTVGRQRSWFSPPGADTFVTDDDLFGYGMASSVPASGSLASVTRTIAKDGKDVVTQTLALPGQVGPETVDVESEVEDLNRQTVASRTSALVHPAEFYVGVRLPAKETFVGSKSAIHPEFVSLAPDGKRTTGVVLSVSLVKRSWATALRADGSEGVSYASKRVDKVIGTCSVTTGNEPTPCTLTTAEAGSYLVRATSKDRRGNPVAATTYLYVTDDRADVSWGGSDPNKVELVTDKKTYEVGDVAKVLVKSPFKSAQALVSVERAGIYSHERREVTGNAPVFEVKITEDMVPNVFVGVMLTRGRIAPKTGAADVGAPMSRFGYAQLVVNPEARRLKVAVSTTTPKVAPGAEVDADVVLTDREGKPAKGELTFYVVDEGVLMLTAYKTPDPLPTFTAPRALSVVPFDSRSTLARVFTPEGLIASGDKGGAGGDGGRSLRSDFRATAFFKGGVVTGDDGRTRVHFKLPDNLTTWRMMAVAVSKDDRFGFGQSTLMAEKSLMARPALPRFFRAGDAVEAGVVVTSKGDAPKTVKVSAAVTGVVLDGAKEKTVVVPPNGSTEVRFAIHSPSPGKAKLTFDAESGADRDRVEVTKSVEVPMVLEAVATAGETEGTAELRMGDLKSLRPDVGGLEIKMASTALLGIGDGAEQLLEYPYGCTEQLTSRLVPLIPARALGKEFAFPLPSDVDRAIDETLGKLLKRQRPSGGFGYWEESIRETPWLSAYVLFALDLAAKDGRHVPKAAIDSAKSYVREAYGRSKSIGRVERAFIVDVLASVGDPDAGFMSKLYDERHDLELSSKAFLLHALAVSGGDAKMRADLAGDVEAHLRMTPTSAEVAEDVAPGAREVLDSTARTTALVLRALLANDERHVFASRLATRLVTMRDGGRYRTTQDAAWALVSLEEYRKAREATPPNFESTVRLAGADLVHGVFEGRSSKETVGLVPTKTLLESGTSNAAFEFTKTGRGTLHYQARLRYAKTVLPTTPIERGLTIEKWIRAAKPEDVAEVAKRWPKASTTEAVAGDLVLVDLLLVSPNPARHVVVDDPLPAGLEAIDATFETSTRSLDAATDTSGRGSDDEVPEDSGPGGEGGIAPTRREVRDDRVVYFVEDMPAGMMHVRYLARATTHGTFVVPPTHAECMYEPEVMGRTGATTFHVAPKKDDAK
ncbi:MAG: alpha-2-macroglobulin family protein [Polyangiaceae bacterium]